jgi:PAS domain S-box-containing protein
MTTRAMKLLKLFRRAPVPDYQPEPVDTEALNDSLKLLQTTATEVSNAAIQASRVLQQRLQDSEHRFSNTIDAVEDFVLIKDGQGRWKKLNTFGQQVFNIHGDEYINKTDQQIATDHPELKQTLELWSITDNIAWDKKTPQRSKEVISHDGRNYYLDMIKTPTYDEQGNRKELIVVGRDVTELYLRAKREKACFTALNSASDAIAILDGEARVFFSNDQFLRIFNIDSYQNIVGRHITDVINMCDDYDSVWNRVRQNNTWYTTVPNTNLVVTIVPVMNGQPHPIYYICTFKAARTAEQTNEHATAAREY